MSKQSKEVMKHAQLSTGGLDQPGAANPVNKHAANPATWEPGKVYCECDGTWEWKRLNKGGQQACCRIEKCIITAFLAEVERLTDGDNSNMAVAISKVMGKYP